MLHPSSQPQLADLRRRAVSTGAIWAQLQREHADLMRRVGLAKARLALRDEVTSVLEEVRDAIHARTVGMYEALLTTFMQETLPEQSVGRRITVDLVTKRGQSSIAFHVTREDGSSESVFDGNGGALTNIVSAALRLIALRKASGMLRQFLVLDEPDCWIAPERVPDFYRVLAEASRDLGIQTLVITHHDPQILERLDAHFVRLMPGKDGVAVDHDPVAWEAGQNGIRSIRLVDYRSHADSFIALSPTVSVLSGPNNLGKSAVIDALRAVAYGEAGDEVIRHGQARAMVEIDLGDKRLVWTRNRKGNPKESYALYAPGSETPLRAEDRSRGAVPAWVGAPDCLGVQLVDDLDVQIGHQKRPTFLLDEPAQKQAAILSVGQEAAWIDRLFAAHKTMVADDQATIRQGEARLTALNRQLTALGGVAPSPSDLGAMPGRLETAFDAIEGVNKQIAEITTLLEEWLGAQKALAAPEPAPVVAAPALAETASLASLLGDLVSAKQHLERLDPAARHMTAPTPPSIALTDELHAILDGLRKLAPTQGVQAPAVIAAAPVLHDVHELAALHDEIRAQSAILTRVQRAESLVRALQPAVAPQLVDVDGVREMAITLTQTIATGKAIAQELRQVQQACAQADEDIRRAKEATGGVCPLCHQPFAQHSGEHHATS